MELRSIPTSTVRILRRRADHGRKHGPARRTVIAIDQTRPDHGNRQVLGELRDDDPGDERLGRQAAGTTRSDAWACTTAPAQRKQAYFGRRVTSPRNWAGITSSRRATSSPIRVISLQPQGQSVEIGSITRSISGRLGGRGLRSRLTR